MPVCPHFLMELHVSLACAVPNGKYVEYIPQLDDLTTSHLRIENGMRRRADDAGHRRRLGLRRGEDETNRRSRQNHRRGRNAMKRMGMVIGLRPERIADYKRIHAGGLAGNLDQDHGLQHQKLLDFFARTGEPAVRLLGISRRRLGEGRSQDGGRPAHPGMVGGHHADAAAARVAQERRMVGGGGRSLSPRLTPLQDRDELPPRIS